MKKTYKKYLEAIMMNDDKKVKNIIPVSAGVILKIGENGEKLLLLIQRAKDDHFPNHWEFPRGRCDKPMGESLIHCLKREVKEETGLDVTPIKEIDTFEYLADKGTRKSICHNFLCRMKDPNQKIKLSKEHQSYRFIQSIGEAEMLVLPDQKKSIDKAFNIDLQIVSYPENHFTKNNSVEEYLKIIQQEGKRQIPDISLRYIDLKTYSKAKKIMKSKVKICNKIKDKPKFWECFYPLIHQYTKVKLNIYSSKGVKYCKNKYKGYQLNQCLKNLQWEVDSLKQELKDAREEYNEETNKKTLDRIHKKNIGKNKARCKKIMILYKQSVARHKKLEKYANEMKRKYGIKSEQWKKAVEVWNKEPPSSNIKIEYDMKCNDKYESYWDLINK